MTKIPSISKLYKKISKNNLQSNTAFKDELWYSRYFGRYASIVFTWFFLHTKISPNQITLLCFLCVLLSGVLLAIPSYPAFLVSFVAFNLYMILDSTDGEVARYTNQRSLLGKYLDKILHVFAYVAVYGGIGAHLWLSSGNLWYLVLGLATSLAFSIASTIFYLDPLLEKIGYQDLRSTDNSVFSWLNNAYNIITGDIEIMIFLFVVSPFHFLGLLPFNIFFATLVVNFAAIIIGGILFNFFKKVSDPRYRKI